MNIKYLLIVLSAAVISSCSTAYKSGQTPDDVYYSPARVVDENVEHRQDVSKKTVDFEERQIRMAVYDRRWRDFNDDYNYRYDPYTYGYGYGYYYNPYYCYYPVYITNVTISNPKNSVPRMTSLGSYNNTTYAISNTKYGSNSLKNPVRPYNNNNNNNNFIRKILTTAENINSSNNNTRGYSPSSGGSSGSSSGGSGGSISRPKRGG